MSVVITEEPDFKELEKISFSDPFQQSLRRTRRALMLVSFFGILIGTFHIEITSFLGFRILQGSINNVYLRGIVNIIVIYYLISFGLSLIIDLYAWDFKKERLRVKHYVDIQDQLGGMIQDLFDENETEELLPEKKEKIIDKILPSFLKNKHFKGTLSGLTIRFVARVISIFFVDILIPIAIGCIAIYKTRYGVLPLIERILS